MSKSHIVCAPSIALIVDFVLMIRYAFDILHELLMALTINQRMSMINLKTI